MDLPRALAGEVIWREPPALDVVIFVDLVDSAHTPSGPT